MALYTGTISYVELKPQIVYNKRIGWTQVRTFSGPYIILNDLGLKIKNQDTNVVNIDLSQPDATGEAKLVVSYAIDILEIWTLTSMDLEKDLWWKPQVREIFDNINGSGIGGFYMLAIKAGFEFGFHTGYTLSEMLVGTFQPTNQNMVALRAAWALLSTAQKTIMTNMYNTLGMSITHYPVSGWIVNKASLVDTFASTYDVHTTYLNLIFTNTDLLTVFDPNDSCPDYIKNSLPATTYSGSIANTNFYMYKSINIEQQNNGRFMVHQQWWFAEDYSKFIYTLYTP